METATSEEFCEADTISPEDLEAAGEFYERLLAGNGMKEYLVKGIGWINKEVLFAYFTTATCATNAVDKLQSMFDESEAKGGIGFTFSDCQQKEVEELMSDAYNELLKERLKIWEIPGTWIKDEYGHNVCAENEHLLKKCEQALCIQVKQDNRVRIEVRIGTIADKWTFGTDVQGSGWGNSYNPSLFGDPYDSRDEAIKAGVQECLETLKQHFERPYEKPTADEKRLHKLILKAQAPQQLNLF